MGIPDKDSSIKALADNLWAYFLPKLEAETRSCLRMEKATVQEAPNGQTVKVIFPFDGTPLDLPYATSMADCKAGDSVWVGMPYSSLSNGVVLFKSNFSNL